MDQTIDETHAEPEVANEERPASGTALKKAFAVTVMAVTFAGLGYYIPKAQEQKRLMQIHEFYDGNPVDSVLNADGTLDLERSTVTIPLKKAEEMRLKLQD